MHNIAEGFEAGTDPVFAHFLKWHDTLLAKFNRTYLALDCTYITQDEFQSAYAMTLDVKRLINRLITYLRKD